MASGLGLGCSCRTGRWVPAGWQRKVCCSPGVQGGGDAQICGARQSVPWQAEIPCRRLGERHWGRPWATEGRLHGGYFGQERGGCSGRGMGTVSAWRQDKGSDFSLSLEQWCCWLEMLRGEEREERTQSQEITRLAGQRDSFLPQDLLLSFSDSVPALSMPENHPLLPSPSCKSGRCWGPPGCPAQSWAQAPVLQKKLPCS